MVVLNPESQTSSKSLEGGGNVVAGKEEPVQTVNLIRQV